MNTLRYIIDKYHIDLAAGTRFDLPGGGRGLLASLWHELGFKVGAEIGIESGRYSVTICATNPGVKLYCVDPWEVYPGYRDHVGQDHLEVLYNDTIARTKPYNCEIIRGFSMDAVKNFEDESLDFVYIDANHDYKHVTEDITEWSKKVRKGGIVSGHDYKISKVGAMNNTIEAVNNYTGAQNIKPWFVWGGDTAPSWMWVKE
jgi:hypothetical protein